MFRKKNHQQLQKYQQENKYNEHESKYWLLPKSLQRLWIAISQVKTGNTSKNVLNEIHQIVYHLFCAKEITKKLYNKFSKGIIEKSLLNLWIPKIATLQIHID